MTTQQLPSLLERTKKILASNRDLRALNPSTPTGYYWSTSPGWLNRLIFAFGSLAMHCAIAEPLVVLPDYRLSPDELAVIVNDQDPLSERIGAYYAKRRKIPGENLLRVSLRPNAPTLSRRAFERAFQKVRAQTQPQVKAYALTWTWPYRVECMSISTAFAAGFDRAWCSERTCAPTRVSPYVRGGNQALPDRSALRPTMVIAATDFAAARALIERGIAADDTHPEGTAYLVSTSDSNRNVRAKLYPDITQRLAAYIDIETVNANSIRGRADVMFYFTGLTRVAHLDTLVFLSGAIGDHLTSNGGNLPAPPKTIGNTPKSHKQSQMSSIEWLRAGATGSYGTVVEPCNLTTKFPHPGILMANYLKGKTLIEAYWRSVGMPGEGIFIGEPLASPFGGYTIKAREAGYQLYTNVLNPGRYRIDQAASPVGPYTATPNRLVVKSGDRTFTLPDTGANVLKLTPLQ